MPPNQAELIQSIRAERERRGLTYQQVVDMCEAAGEAVCFNTVQKVLTAPLPDAARCRASTVQAIANAVLERPSEAQRLRQEFDTHTVNGIEDRNRQIRRLQNTVDALQAEIARKTHTLHVLAVWVFVATALLLIVSSFLLGYLVWDVTHPAQGFIRY